MLLVSLKENRCIMFRKITFVAIHLAIAFALMAQPPQTKEEFEKQYQKRIQQEVLDGVYIPADLTDAFVQLNKLIDPESKAKFKAMAEEDAVHKLYFSFGRWIIHNWGFYGGSRLSHHIRDLGITFPEDMAAFIILSYHRNLNRKELKIKEQVTYYQEKIKKEQEERLEKGKVIHEETKKVNKGN